MMKNIDGEIHGRAIEGQYLKKFYPTLWVAYGKAQS